MLLVLHDNEAESQCLRPNLLFSDGSSPMAHLLKTNYLNSPNNFLLEFLNPHLLRCHPQLSAAK